MKQSSVISCLLVGLFLTGLGTWAKSYGAEYFIINANSGKCLDASNRYSGSPVTQWTCHGGDNQRWREGEDAIDPGTGGSHLIQLIDTKSGMCLDIRGGSKNDGAQLQIYPCKDGVSSTVYNQHFVTNSITSSSKTMMIKAVHSGKCFDVPYASQSNGIGIQQYTCHGGLNQQWVLVPAF